MAAERALWVAAVETERKERIASITIERERRVALAEERAGSVCLNSFGSVAKWISALVMPQPGLAATH
jgi:hypothetical protein